MTHPFSPRFITTRDGTRLRCGVFEAKPRTRGVCVLLHGQTEFIEKYDEVIAELLSRGFTVATFDWRGQGGSARALANPLPAHVRDFAQYDDDLTSFLDQVVRPLSDGPPLALAHSMGAHILLRTLHDRPDALRAAVLSAPMIQVSTRGYPGWLARGVCAMENVLGQGDAFAWGMAARDPFLITFDTQLVTSDRERFAAAQKFLSDHPELRLAGPTWGWLEAAYRSMAKLRAAGYAQAITTPVLVCGAGHDRICVNAAGHDFATRMPHGRWTNFEDSEHEVLMENDSIRSRFWVAFDTFAT